MPLTTGRMRRTLAGVALATCVLAGATGCGSTSAGGSVDGSGGGSSAPKVIEVTFSGDDVTPNGTTVDVALGQPVELHVTADAPGEIHVHSTPEQELEYAAGTSTVDLAPLTIPGTVEVESHVLEKTIVQLRVQ